MDISVSGSEPKANVGSALKLDSGRHTVFLYIPLGCKQTSGPTEVSGKTALGFNLSKHFPDEFMCSVTHFGAHSQSLPAL